MLHVRQSKYGYRSDIRDRTALEANFRKQFEALNRVRLTDAEFQRLLDEIITSDVFAAAQILRRACSGVAQMPPGSSSVSIKYP